MGPEISDLIVSYDPRSLERRAVRKADVIAALRAVPNRRAARIVERFPASDGVLDAAAMDGILVRSHCELQRLNEEFRQGPRVLGLLRALIAALRASGAPTPIRVVDVGCGVGYMVRWLAAMAELGDDVELCGCDYNAALIAEARRVSALEELRVRFEVANAFTLAEPAAIFMSTGVIHHFRGPELVDFFRGQTGAQAFMHYDITPSLLAPIGAWIFHVARMREPLARHDGVLSARRAHADGTLLEAAREGAPRFEVMLFDRPPRWFPLIKVLRPVLGLREALLEPFLAALGPLARRLEPRP